VCGRGAEEKPRQAAGLGQASGGPRAGKRSGAGRCGRKRERGEVHWTRPPAGRPEREERERAGLVPELG